MERLKYRVWDKLQQRYRTDLLLGQDGNVVLPNGPDGDSGRFCVEQCTGLRDMNDDLIYDGDILTDGMYNGFVEWNNGSFHVALRDDRGEDVGFIDIGLEIINRGESPYKILGSFYNRPATL